MCIRDSNYDDIVDDDAVKALQRVADDQLTGTDAEFYYYRCLLYTSRCV